MAPSAPAVCAAPAPPPAPDRVEHLVDFVNPGGDPAVLRRAAGAWRQMATRLRASAGELGAAVHEVGTSWQGPARQAFSGHWSRLEASMDEGARTFDQIAANLDQVADQITETNEQVHQLYAAVGVTIALGVALSVVTVGFGSAAAAGAAGAQAAQAATVVARLGTFLTVSARAMSGFRAAFVAFSQRWAVAAAGNGLATAAQKAVVNSNHNPFDGWTISDVTKIAVAATSTAGVTGLAAGSTRLAPLAGRHPLAAGLATGFAGGAGASVVNDTWVDRRPLSMAMARNALVNGAAGGAGSMAAEAVLLPRGLKPPTLVGPGPGPGLVAVRRPSLWLPGRASPEALAAIPVDGAVQSLVTIPLAPPPPPVAAPQPLPPTAPHYR